MAIMQSRKKYLISLTDEILSSADRIRDLIGSKHWLTDGHHKEAILLSVLERHLPAGTKPTRGFVVTAFESDHCSTEQDILILNTLTEAPLFDQGNVAIAFPHQVFGAISVKTTLDTETLKDAADGLQTIGEVPESKVGIDSRWYGLYFYNESEIVAGNRQLVLKYVNSLLKTTDNASTEPRFPAFNCLCCGRDILVKPRSSTDDEGNRVIKPVAYNCDGLAPALFLADLLDHIAATRGASESGIAASLDNLPFALL